VTQDRFDMIYVHVWDINICFESAMTIVKTYTPNQIPGYAPDKYKVLK